MPPGLPAAETIAAVRTQGGLVGIPHPFDRFRGSLLRDAGWSDSSTAVDWVEAHNARVVGRQRKRAGRRAGAREHGRPGVAVSDAHSVVRGRRRLHRARRRPLHAGRAAGRAADRPSSSRAGRRYYVRLWTPIAKVVQRLRGNGRRPAASPRLGAMSGPRQAHRPMADGTGRRAQRPERWRPRPATPTAATPGRRAAPPRTTRTATTPSADEPDHADQMSLGRRLRQPRTIISLIRPARHPARLLRSSPAGLPARGAPGPDRRRQPGPGARGVRRLLSRLPAARLALGDPAPRHRLRLKVTRLRPRSSSCQLAGQLPRPGQARRPLSRLSAEDQQPGLAVAHVRDRLHRADPRPLRHRDPRPRWPATGGSASGLPPARSSSCSRSA